MTGQDFAAAALALAGTVTAPHFDRTAFKVKRIYATLASDGKSANLKLSPDEQEFHCLLNPGAFSQIDNAWGRQGWTRVELARIDAQSLRPALEAAWRRGAAKR
jgi:hypothetical protein